MIKKIIGGFLTTALVLSMPFTVSAGTVPDIFIDGQKLQTGQNPVIKDGRTLVPFRAIAEGLGATVLYDGATQKIVAQKEDTVLTFTLNRQSMTVNGEKTPLDVSPQLINGYTMLPVRAFVEALRGTVNWEEGRVLITSSLPATDRDTVQELVDQSLGEIKLHKHCLEDKVKYWSFTVNDVEMGKIPETGAYDYANLKVQDLTGDGQPELLLYRYNTGTAGAVALTVFSLRDNQYAPIFQDNNWPEEDENNFQVNYAGNYQVEFYEKGTGLYTLIPVDAKSYPDEELLQAITTWVDPVIKYEFVDSRPGGAKNIVTHRRVIGAGHAHTLAVLHTTYRLENGGYIPVKITLYDPNNNFLAEGYYKFTGAPDYMNEQSAVILAAEAVSRSRYVLRGGNITEEVEAFTLNGITYRYLGGDLDTQEKLTAYLEEVFTPETRAAFLESYGIMEFQGKMAQPDADGGSLLEWNRAQASLIDEGDNWKRYEFKIPYPAENHVEFEVMELEVKLTPQGWLLHSLPF